MKKVHIYIAIAAFSPISLFAAATDDLGTFAQWITGGPFGTGVIDALLVTLVSLAVLYFTFGAYQFIVSGSNMEMRDMGRSRMINGVIGIFFMLSIWGFVNILRNTFDFGAGRLSGDSGVNSRIVVPEAATPLP